MKPEKSIFVDQQPMQKKLATVENLLADHPALFRRQGTVVRTWRENAGRVCGPYYALRYRQNGQQRSLYLGTSVQLAARVEQLLRDVQQPQRHSRRIRQLRAAAKSALRRHKIDWEKQLDSELGITLKGYEVRHK